jgi:hypothetical protein
MSQNIFIPEAPVSLSLLIPPEAVPQLHEQCAVFGNFDHHFPNVHPDYGVLLAT